MSSIIKLSIFAVILAIIAMIGFALVMPQTNNQKIDLAQKEDLPALDDTNTIEKAYMYNVSEGDGYGIVKRAYAPGEFILYVEAGIPELSNNEMLVATIVNQNGEEVNIGQLQKSENEYYVEFQSNKDLRSFNKIEIKKQNSANQLINILEGKFDGTAT